jgi:bifunctional DNA-binding transcriptional regulator/antitoxin component of YhaV-PrlF toxin-antitoxin module
MQEEYTGTLLEDGHISIPKEIVDKLNIGKGSKLRVTVSVEKGVSKDTILSYAGMLSDLTGEQEKRFDESVKRRSFFQNRKAQI